MKKFNEFISKIQNEIPLVTNKIEKYGEGYILQALMFSRENKAVKEEAKEGIYIGNMTEHNHIKAQVIEVLYSSNAEKKLYSRNLVEELEKRFKDKYVYLSYLEESKDLCRIQFYILDNIKTYV